MTLTVGVLTPHAAPGPEVELPAMAPVDVVVARTAQPPPTAAVDLRALATLSALQPAVAALRESSVDVIAYASTTTGYAIGPEAEAELIRHLSELADVPVVSSGLAARQALKTFGVRRIALIHPPWFEHEMADLGVKYFQEFDIVTLTATPLPHRPDLVQPEQIIDYVTNHVDASTDAIFIAGNGFRAATTIDQLERHTTQLVLTANQALLWSILSTTTSTLQINNYGKLFQPE